MSASEPVSDLRRSVAVLGDRVLVSPPGDAERRSKAGILIPATAKSVDRKGIWGETIGVGPHVRHVQLRDEVLSTTVADFRAFADTLTRMNGRSLIVVMGHPEKLQAASETLDEPMEIVRVL